MAMSNAKALIIVHCQRSYNRMLHQAGLGGTAISLLIISLIALVMLVFGFTFMRVGWNLGQALLAGDPPALRNWNLLQAIFTLSIGLLGSILFKPILSHAEFGRHPLTQWDLALAELSAAGIDAIPILGIFAIVSTNLGLMGKAPWLILPIALLTALNILGMLSLIVAAANLRRLLFGYWWMLVTVGIVGAGWAILGSGWHGWMDAMQAVGRGFAWLSDNMPGAYGYRGLWMMREGYLSGIWGLVIAIVATLGLVVIAALADHQTFRRNAWQGGPRKQEVYFAAYRGPVCEVSRFYFRQLVRSGSVRGKAIIPLLMIGCFCWVLMVFEHAQARGVLYGPGLALHRSLLKVPCFALALYSAVIFNKAIWMNQFGWDRAAIRTFLLLPLTPQDILLGKLLGLLKFTLLQWGVCGGGVLMFYRPSCLEILGGFMASGIAFMIACIVGQYASLLAPRAVTPGRLVTNIPLYLFWVPSLTLGLLGILMVNLWQLGQKVGYGLAPTLLLGLLVGTLLLVRMQLPALERWFLHNREKLLSM